MNIAKINQGAEALSAGVVTRLIHDPEFRRRVRQRDADALAEIGYAVSIDPGEAMEMQVVTSTQDTTYVALPLVPDDVVDIDIENLGQIQAAGDTQAPGCTSTVGSTGSFGTLSSTLSSAGSAGTASTREV